MEGFLLNQRKRFPKQQNIFHVNKDLFIKIEQKSKIHKAKTILNTTNSTF